MNKGSKKSINREYNQHQLSSRLIDYPWLIENGEKYIPFFGSWCHEQRDPRPSSAR